MQSFGLTNYIESPRKGEILGPQTNPIFLNFSQETSSSIQLQKLERKKNILETEISEAQLQFSKMFDMFERMQKNQEQGKVQQAKKQKRRGADEFAVHFFCPHKGCNKYYGVQSALNRHIKLKHYCIKAYPPDYYHELQPSPDLAENLYQQSSLSVFNSDQDLKKQPILNEKRLVHQDL